MVQDVWLYKPVFQIWGHFGLTPFGSSRRFKKISAFLWGTWPGLGSLLPTWSYCQCLWTLDAGWLCPVWWLWKHFLAHVRLVHQTFSLAPSHITKSWLTPLWPISRMHFRFLWMVSVVTEYLGVMMLCVSPWISNFQYVGKSLSPWLPKVNQSLKNMKSHQRVTTIVSRHLRHHLLVIMALLQTGRTGRVGHTQVPFSAVDCLVGWWMAILSLGNQYDVEIQMNSGWIVASVAKSDRSLYVKRMSWIGRHYFYVRLLIWQGQHFACGDWWLVPSTVIYLRLRPKLRLYKICTSLQQWSV